MFLFFSLLPAQADSFQSIQNPYADVRATEHTSRSTSSDGRAESFLEMNFGLAALGPHGSLYGLFPGTSFLWGSTGSHSGFVYELQIGAALPTILTGKLGVGVGDLNNNLMIAVRPWPQTIGPQVTIRQWTMSFEICTGNESSANTSFIGTVGYRWTL